MRRGGDPCYQSLVEVAKSIECEVVPWQLRETERGWKMHLDHLEDLLAGDTQLLVLNADSGAGICSSPDMSVEVSRAPSLLIEETQDGSLVDLHVPGWSDWLSVQRNIASHR